jgi:hypothetical protein
VFQLSMSGIGQPPTVIDPAKRHRGANKAFNLQERKARPARNGLIESRSPSQGSEEKHHCLTLIRKSGQPHALREPFLSHAH